MPSPGSFSGDLPPLAASVRGNESHRCQTPLAVRLLRSSRSLSWRTRALSASLQMLSLIEPCSSRRPGEAVGVCCTVRRTLRCDGKLLSPERRRRAVVVLQDRFRVSQRRACRLTGQHRNTQRRTVPLAGIEEQKLRSRIRELARRHVRWGRRLDYRRLRLDASHQPD